MLHDIGKLVLAVNVAESYKDVVRLVSREHNEYYQAEEQVFGANHADVGGRILSYWGLSHSVVEAISLHHAPNLAVKKVFSPLTVVHAANAILRHQKGGVPTELAVDMAYLEELGLAERLPVWCEALEQVRFSGGITIGK